jgi:hypothetical protein
VGGASADDDAVTAANAQANSAIIFIKVAGTFHLIQKHTDPENADQTRKKLQTFGGLKIEETVSRG